MGMRKRFCGMALEIEIAFVSHVIINSFQIKTECISKYYHIGVCQIITSKGAKIRPFIFI